MSSYLTLLSTIFVLNADAFINLPDNGTPQCEYAHEELLKEMQNAEDEHLKYK